MTETQNNWQQQQPVMSQQNACQQQQTQPQPEQQQQYYYQQPVAYQAPKQRRIAVTLALLLGGFGAHKFYTGATMAAVIMLLVSVIGAFFTFGVSYFVMQIIASIEFCTYICMSDEEWQQVYVTQKKAWF